VRNQTSPGPADLFYRELDPKVVADLAIIESGDNPRELGALRVVIRMIVATVVGKLFHARDVAMPGARVTKDLLAVMFDDFLGPHSHVVWVLAGSSTSAALAEQVPALVEGDLDLAQPLELLFRKLLALV
jgi:hypothetical protein